MVLCPLPGGPQKVPKSPPLRPWCSEPALMESWPRQDPRGFVNLPWALTGAFSTSFLRLQGECGLCFSETEAQVTRCAGSCNQVMQV